MPLQKLNFVPGLNREGTSYSVEGQWYDGDKIRFRSGKPEKIGGWTQVSPTQFLGTCRSLWTWVDLQSNVFIGLGTTSKYYIYSGGFYNDITPIYYVSTLAASTIASTASSTAITITDTNYNPNAGDYIIIPNATVVDSVTLSGEYIVSAVISSTKYQINSATAATTNATNASSVVIDYEFPSGLNSAISSTGWGVGPWGGVSTSASFTLPNNPFTTSSNSGTVIVSQPAHGLSAGQYIDFSNASSITGTGIYSSMLNSTYTVTASLTASTYSITLPSSFVATATAAGGGTGVVVEEQSGTRGWGTAYSNSTGINAQLRLWTNDNFGQDLVLAPRGGPIYYWQDSAGVTTRAVSLASLANSNASTIQTVSFANGATVVGVTSASGIYPYAYVTGTGMVSGTQVSSNYTIGSTLVPITIASTASATGTNLTFSYAGQYVPVSTLQVITSAIQEFVIAFGSNSYNGGTYSATFNPMLVRWSDQANAYQWVPQVTNQSGEFALSNGSYIVGARATRQEILIWTNTALYTMQYIGYPYVWSFNILMDNISTMSPNCMATINNITYWMGTSKFYYYDGSVHTLPSTLRQYVFDDLNINQAFQVFCGPNEGYNEVWWFYVSNESINNSIDKYVVFNYLDKCWYYGTFETVQINAGSFVVGKQYVISSVGTTNFTAIGAANNNVGTYFVATGTGSGNGTAWGLNGRSAWLQDNIQSYPVSADYNNRLLYQENGVDDNATSNTQPIYAYIQSSDFGIMASDQNNSGQHFGFVWRLLPDVNFNGSNVANPQVTMALYPRLNSGTAYGTTDLNAVTSSQTYAYPTPQEYTVQQFTGEVYTRLRGRQMAFKCYSNTIGTTWQLGTPRYDVKQDGRR